MNKTAVITGAGGVLCSVIAIDLAKSGYSVALLDLNYDSAKKTEDEIVNLGGKAKAYKADCLNKESLIAVREEVRKDFGEVSLLINGAGGNNGKANTSSDFFTREDMRCDNKKTFFDLDPANIDFVFKLNFLTAFVTSQVFAEGMLENGGNIINISSMNAFRPLTRIPAYSGAKAAVSNFTEWLSVYFAAEGIRVNAIAPGFFVTNQNYSLLYNEDGTLTDRANKIINSTPMGRFGKPDELLGAIRWLANDGESGFVTGIVIPIDGGFSAYSGV